jgi:hypothetical protein
MSSDPLDYPGLKELAAHLAEILAMQEGDGWHTFRMDVKASPDGERVWVDNLSLTTTFGEWVGKR